MANGINLMDRQPYSYENIIALLSQNLRQNQYLEFLIEEFIKTEENEYKIPDDYKIYISNGEVAVIEVINRLSPTEGALSCYDANWNLIPNTAINKFDQAPFQKPPKCIDEKMEQLKRLSKTYEIFVRINFYAIDKGAVFGEFTPGPGAANYLTNDTEKKFIRNIVQEADELIIHRCFYHSNTNGSLLIILKLSSKKYSAHSYSAESMIIALLILF